MMLKLIACLCVMQIAQVADNTWWRSPAGSVTEHRNGNQITCTLTLTGEANRVSFAWSNFLPVRVVAEGGSLQLRPDDVSEVSVRIGNVWLAGGDGTPNIPALTANAAVMFVLSEPVTEVLRPARQILVRTSGGAVTVHLNADRTGDLLRALDLCSAVIQRLR